jgi:hypothetical protein
MYRVFGTVRAVGDQQRMGEQTLPVSGVEACQIQFRHARSHRLLVPPSLR